MAPKTKKKAAKKKGKDQKSLEKELSALEQNALELWRAKDKERVGPPKFEAIDKESIEPKEKNPDRCGPQLLEATGSTDPDFCQLILNQALSTYPLDDPEIKGNFTSALLHGLRPRDETEGVLIAQVAGTHNLIMEYMRRAVFPKQTFEAADVYTNRACKLMNIFLKQIEMLQKYRGKAAQQKVIVEHVHIHEGGKAVVGHFEDKSGGRGEDGEK